MTEKQKYKDRFYEITVLLPIDGAAQIVAGVSQRGSVNIVNKPFIMTRITHGIIGHGQIIAGAAGLIQDGQYDLEMRTDQYNYQTAPLSAVLMCGSGADWLDLPTPEELAPKTTISIIVTNTYLRAIGEPVRIQIVFHGLEPIGSVEEG